MLRKSLIRFSVDGQGCVPSLLFGLRPNYDRGNEGNGDLLQKGLCQYCCIQCPDPTAGHCRLTPPLETPGHSQASLAQSLVGTLLLSPGSWYTQGFVCALQESVFPVLWKFYNQIPLAPKIKFPGRCQSFCRIPRLGNLLCLFYQNVLIRSITIWTLLCSEHAQCLGLCSMKCVLSRV